MVDPSVFDGIFVVMLVLCFLIRAPLEFRNRKIRAVDTREDALGRLCLLLVFTGSTTLPLLYLFTHWFDFADYTVGSIPGAMGTVLACLGVFLFWKTHHDLGRQFSPTLEMKETHTLVSHGIYRKIRHPMYTAVFTVAAAQLLLVGNLVVGPAFLLAFALLYFTRVDHEEKMMLDHFGSAYADYAQRTNRLFPSFRRS